MVTNAKKRKPAVLETEPMKISIQTKSEINPKELSTNELPNGDNIVCFGQVSGVKMETTRRIQELTESALESEGLFDAARVFSGSPILMFPVGDRFFASLCVADVARALLTIDGELRRSASLEWFEILHYGAQGRSWHSYFPKNSNQRFDNVIAILKIAVYTAMNRPLHPKMQHRGQTVASYCQFSK